MFCALGAALAGGLVSLDGLCPRGGCGAARLLVGLQKEWASRRKEAPEAVGAEGWVRRGFAGGWRGSLLGTAKLAPCINACGTQTG